MYPFIELIGSVIYLYSLSIFIWVALGLLIYFKIVNAYQPLVRKVNETLTRLIEPALRPIRKILPDLGGIDIYPIILLLLLNFLRNSVYYYGMRL